MPEARLRKLLAIKEREKLKDSLAKKFKHKLNTKGVIAAVAKMQSQTTHAPCSLSQAGCGR